MSLTITIPGAVNVTTGATAPATLTVGVGVPGATGAQGPAGVGVPAGGTTGQYLVKTSNTDWATNWATLSLNGYATEAWVDAQGYLQAGALTGYLLSSTAASTYYLQTNPSGFITSSALSPYLLSSTAASTYAVIAAGQPTSGTVGQVLTKNSGTNYDSSWTTLIPGDRYVTTSTTSNSVSNGAKTFTVGTGLSYSSQQDVVISYNAANHMHAVVTSYDSGTGVLVVDVQNHTGSGTYTAWTVNVGGTTPLQTVEWGEILGTLGDQSDLATALNAKLETSTAASTYAALAGATFTGEVATPASTTSTAGFSIAPGTAPSSPVNGEIWNTGSDLQVRLGGVTETLAEQSWVTSQGYLTSAPVTSVASKTGAVTLVVGDVSGAAALAGSTFTGLIVTPASTTTTAGLRLPHGAAPTAPTDGDVWSTTGGLFWRQSAATKQAMNLGDTQTVSGNITFSNANVSLGTSTAAGTINVGSGATVSASTKTVNVGTAGVSGSTTNVNIGSSVAGATSTTTVNGTFVAAGVTANLGSNVGASTINVGTGATTTGLTKAVNIGTSGVAGSTTNIAIGSTTGTSTTTLQGITNGVTQTAGDSSTKLATTAFVTTADNLKANIASPTFTGVPAAPTATAGTNTTQIATTAFVTAAVPAFAATADTNAPSSTTKVMSPSNVLDMILHQGNQLFYQGVGDTGTSGSGSAVYSYSGRWKEYVAPSAGVAGYAKGIWDSTTNSYGFTAYSRGQNIGYHDWSKKIWIAGRTMLGHPTISTTYDGDANTFSRISLGGYTAVSAGDMSASLSGFGWKVAGGGTAALQLVTVNGTTLTTVTSSFTPTLRQAFDWKIYSDGAGNVTLYVNDSQVATTTAGPTIGSSYGLYMEGVDSTASSTKSLVIENFGTKIYHSV